MKRCGSPYQGDRIVHSLLLEHLDDLLSNQLERFHSYLSHEPPQGYNPISRSCLEGSSRTKTAEQMLVHYGSEGAVKVTLYILEKMNLNEQAVTLQRGLESTSYGENPRAPGGTISGVITASQPQPPPAVSEHDASLRADQEKLKAKLRNRYQHIFEGVAKHGRSALLTKVYTEVFITEGECGQVNTEHEVWNIESTSKETHAQDVQIECNKIFQPLPGQEDHIRRSVLTKGIAGIGKTVSVQKFILDWAEGKANRGIDLIFPLPFRELNLMRDRKLSLLGLIRHFHPEVKHCTAVDLNSRRVLFIFDGLDECRLPLNFHSNEPWYDETEELSVDMLLTNLIQGNLLPSALLWITSRPAAASQIPPECIQRLTEVRGFNDPQKDEYFTKRFNDQNLANKIISHIKSSRTLHIMCHIPVFCLISATVLESLLDKSEGGQIPKTLTQMYTQFLRIQIMIKNQKYHRGMETNTKEMQETDKEITVNLGKLAFQHLEKNNLIFYEQDLKESGIDASKSPEYSGLYTEIFKEESVLYEEKTYSFVHLSIQEYLAALSVHFLYVNGKENPLNLDMSKHTSPDGGIKLSAVHRSAVDKALQSPNGHLDLFVRFLLGISLDSKALSGLLPHTECSSQMVAETVKYIKEKVSKCLSPERTINLFHCLNELNDDSLVQEIQSFLKSSGHANQKLYPDQCSALAYALVMSEKQVDVLDFRMYNSTQAGYRRLLPVLKHTRTALLQVCDLTPALCALVNVVLQSSTSLLRELDLGYNSKLGDKGCKLLCDGLRTPHCRLQTLGLGDCNLTKGCCDDLASVLRSRHSQLRELDLRGNDLLDSGVTALSAGLEDPLCKLQKLGLSGCGVTETGCRSLASALHSNPSHLIELDLSYNNPGDLGVKVLSTRQQDPNCALEKLIVDHGGVCRMNPGLHKYDCHLTVDPSTAAPNVVLSEGNRRAHRKQKFGNDEYTPPVLCKEALTDRHYWEVEWGPGSLEVGVAYQIPTSTAGALGEDDQSWAIRCNPQGIMAVHNNKLTHIVAVHAQAKYRVGVYLDWQNGTLAFYKISSKGPVHLHTFHVTFTLPLYPAFALTMDAPMTLC
ncbi:NACHT, LRR and PYD domains-containing protein 12-like isoform X3 [Anguilla rostrata]|uniref:NACHT, LRR and PYD domains-containing protein 12-like isoform X3 n=1 Tax=Anguilla rostrata TaxID=7938 RepID=UPI0030CD69B3